MAGALFGAWLVYRSVEGARALREVARQSWVSERLVTAQDTVWYRAAFNGRKGTVVALDRLLAW
ncbi:TPA: hypothetical protein I9742_001866 [Serratia marcescens]|nr:hypothetical protein [Serratia marcescens]